MQTKISLWVHGPRIIASHFPIMQLCMNDYNDTIHPFLFQICIIIGEVGSSIRGTNCYLSSDFCFDKNAKRRVRCLKYDCKTVGHHL